MTSGPLMRAVRVRVKIHPLLLVTALAACLAHMFLQVAILFVCVLLHELGHAAVARSLGYKVDQIELLPFGGAVRLLNGDLGCQPRHEAVVAIAGPMVNLGLGWVALAFAASGLSSSEAYQTWVTLNLWIGVFNLLPCLPLDGGRLWRANRSRTIGYARATEGAYRMAFVVSALFMALGVIAFFAGRPHIGALVLGLFLAITAWQGLRDVRIDIIRFLDGKRGRSGSTTRVRALAARMDAPIREVVRQFAPDRVHLVYVLDDAGRVVDIVEEREIIEAVFSGAWDTPVRELSNPAVVDAPRL
ncbi:M50 family metallopeptidase [Alicyclobacillus mali]|uniref:M50 family metallopeptidase n=1 Tax=Alicyclobacillus mali (ex Roth et al. 2021) TaxID=1123961 RepID=A0ABS0F647_9BACL|nr:site-2 protease family protein [Alicyclobacillus mali (ex Roth et al. 2021)]MBF8378743.1 M50 family metallopeptidase [Alicyclobacillus mali (ex Roth et al. 2021)]MCL6488216.1 site-2 protease family protein [Alicyclobacillus mali (ex Roth et al. 2021)]